MNDELKQASKGLCIWQTHTGMPWSSYCQDKAIHGNYCAEHDRDKKDLYGAYDSIVSKES